MIIKDNLKINGAIASKMYLTTDSSGNINGSLSSGGGGGDGGGGGSTLVYQGRSETKDHLNYINDNYYEVEQVSITTGPFTIDQQDEQRQQVPGTWSSPFIINDTNLNIDPLLFITNKINVKIVDTSNNNVYIGTIDYDKEIYTDDYKIIYNFTDSNIDSPYTLDTVTSKYNLNILLYYIQPSDQKTDLDKYNFNQNNAIMITRGNLAYNAEYFNVKLIINTRENDIPGTFKIFMITDNQEAQRFSYPPIYDDDGNSLNITADAFILSSINRESNHSVSTLVTNFPIIEANISIISYVNI